MVGLIFKILRSILIGIRSFNFMTWEVKIVLLSGIFAAETGLFLSHIRNFS